MVREHDKSNIAGLKVSVKNLAPYAGVSVFSAPPSKSLEQKRCAPFHMKWGAFSIAGWVETFRWDAF
jgi:hypothetical protein